MGERRTVIVSVTDDALPSMGPVVDSLKKCGVEVERVLEFTGNVVGTFEGELDELTRLRGVHHVEVEEIKRSQTPPRGQVTRRIDPGAESAG